MYGCFFSDQFGLENLDHVGVDNVMFERRARRFDLAPGYPADRFVFDRDEIRRPARREYGRDLAGGIGRFQAYPSGVRATIVSGVVIVRDGQAHGRAPRRGLTPA